MKEKIARIRVLALDVDGVLTGGKIIYDNEGGETKCFDVKDGYGLLLVKKAGLRTAIISGRTSRAVERRAQDLRIDRLYQNAWPKTAFYQEMLKDFGVTDAEVCFIGDDLLDVPVLRRVGFAVAVADAVEEVKAAADYVTTRRGGEGAVRELAELILKTRGLWERVLDAA